MWYYMENMNRQLFLDCDGVLANFDKRAIEIVGMPPRDFEDLNGASKFWKKIFSAEDFFFTLEPMPDAFELVDAVRHLNPIILTGKPQSLKEAEEQKLRWRDKYFPDLDMIVCFSEDKIKHAKPGDVIVDDWPKYRQIWIDGGGVWIDHYTAEQSIAGLKKIGML